MIPLFREKIFIKQIFIYCAKIAYSFRDNSGSEYLERIYLVQSMRNFEIQCEILAKSQAKLRFGVIFFSIQPILLRFVVEK